MMYTFPSPFDSLPTGMAPFVLSLSLLFVVVAVWSIAVKGYALWHAAHANQKGWFIALLVFNTAGILELVYLLGFCPARPLAQYFKKASASQKEPSTVSSETPAS